MRRDGLKLSFFGLLLGVILGSGILAFKSFVAQQLVGLLETMVTTSTDGCHFRADAISFSLLRLAVTAKRPRMECSGKDELSFRDLRGRFDLSDVLSRRVYLSRLTLRDGSILGGTPGTNAYRFINYLAAPVPPERDSPDRWKLKLRELVILSTSVTGAISKTTFLTKSPRFTISRTPENDFTFRGEASVILKTALLGSVPETFDLGTLRVDFLATDTHLHVQQAQLELPNHSTISAAPLTLDLRSDGIDAQIRYGLNFPGLPAVPSWIQGSIRGEGTLRGIGEEVVLQSQLQSTSPEFLLGDPTSPMLQFSSLSSQWSAAATGPSALLSVSTLLGGGDGSQLNLTTPIRITPRDLRGGIHLRLNRAGSDDIGVEGLDAQVELSGSLNTPRAELRGTLERPFIGALSTRPVPFHGALTPTRVDLEVGSPSEDFYATLALLLSDPRGPRIERGSVALKQLAFFPSSAPSDAPRMLASGALELSGPLERDALSAKGLVRLSAPTAPFSANFQTELRAGVLTAEMANERRSLMAKLTLPLRDAAQGSFSASLDAFSIGEVASGLECLDTSLRLNYGFPVSAPDTGNGEVALSTLTVGCAPHDLRLARPVPLAIRNGEISLSGLGVRNGASEITLAGPVSFSRGFDLAIRGAFDLESLAKLLPNVDDLHGHVTATAHVRGALSAPLWDGSASVINGGVSSEAAGIAATQVTGSLRLTADRLEIENLGGDLNGGRVALTGNVEFANLHHSLAALSFDGVTISPMENASITLSGNVELSGRGAEAPVLSGSIQLDSGELRRRLDLRTVVSFLSQLALERARSLSATRTLPRIDLDLTVEGTRNLFVITNWASAELDAQLAINGNLAMPLVRGNVRTLSGWVGIKDHRFEITSGSVRFEPGLAEPELELLGETTARSSVGESVVISLDVRGPVSDPRVTLTSDSGLTQKEIIQILTISGNASRQTRANAWYSQFENDVRSEPFALTRFLRSLARIDILSLEPAYNPVTGNYEPTIIARKEITDRLSLHASSALAGAGSALIEGVYALSPSINISGGIESERSRQQSALIADLTYTIRARHRPFLHIDLHTDGIDGQTLLESLRLGDTSRVPSRDLARIERQIVEWSVSQGYRDASAKVSCEEDAGWCRTMTVQVNAGSRHTVESYELVGDHPHDRIGYDPLPAIQGKAATSDLERHVREQVTRAFRAEGFLATRVSTDLLPGSSPTGHRLRVSVSAGVPVTFIFEGNTQFSSEEFLSTINLFKRQQPFGNNTVQILLENIDRLYREEGYLYATIREQPSRDALTGRLTHTISIHEDQPVPVSSVVIEGGDLPTERLRALIRERYPEEGASIFEPRFAVEELLEGNAHLLQEVYAEEGFPSASVAFRLVPVESSHSVSIVYAVTPGEPLRGNSIQLDGFPDGVARIEPPSPPYSIPKMNRYSTRILTALIEAGYVNAEVQTDFDQPTERFLIQATAGEQVHVGEIRIDGTRDIQPGIILHNLTVHPGVPWEEAKLLEARRRLLQLGLFSRVELLPTDGQLDSTTEALTVRVEERPLTSIEVGTGVNSEYGLHLFGEATDRDLFRDGRTLSLRLDAYYDDAQTAISQGTASLRFVHPAVFDSGFRLTEDLRFEKVERSTQEYNLEQSALASYLTYSISDRFTGTFGHTFTLQDISSVPRDVILSPFDRGNLRLGFVSASAAYDGRDDPLRPTRGFAAAVDARISAPALGSEATYTGVVGRFSLIQPLGGVLSRWSVAEAFRTGALWPLGSTDEIPITQRFYLGGRNSVRGFRENSLGPRGEAGGVIGGDLLFANAFELRYAFRDDLSLHTFLDTGSVFLRDHAFAWSDLRFSSGIGVQYLSPIGPVGLDLGHPLDEASGEPSWRIHFSVGSTF